MSCELKLYLLDVAKSLMTQETQYSAGDYVPPLPVGQGDPEEKASG